MKTFYIVVNRINWLGGSYGKSTKLSEAMKLCKVSFKDNFTIYQAIVNESATEEELENLCKCFNVNDYGGVSMYHPASKVDLDMAERLMIGWITEEFKNK
jgi:hypothetical protein